MQETGHRISGVLRQAWSAALAAADPAVALAGRFPAAPPGRLVVLAAGKAAPGMARAALDHYLPQAGLAGRMTGLVAAPQPDPGDYDPLEWFQAAHPVPDSGSVAAGERTLELLDQLTTHDLVLVLLSGGASSLLTAPDGISLAQMQELADALLASGADIGQMNTVRRKLCRLKGGGLAQSAAPARVVALVMSDVVGDDLAAIGSGPTTPDPDTPADALLVLDEFGIGHAEVRERLGQLAGQWGAADAGAESLIIASGHASLQAAAAVLAAQGFTPWLLSDSVTGDSAVAAAEHAVQVRQILQGSGAVSAPCAVLSGGETTVRLQGPAGDGGRNSAFALNLACELWGMEGLWALCADTDGKDGKGDAAGAFITPELFRLTSLADARAALARNDSGGFFRRFGHAHVTGATGTNVNDLRMIVLESQ